MKDVQSRNGSCNGEAVSENRILTWKDRVCFFKKVGSFFYCPNGFLILLLQDFNKGLSTA